MFKIDALGQACPLPVIETKKALKEHTIVETVVDNEIATQNLKKMADQLGYMSQIKKDSDAHYTVVTSKPNKDLVNETPEVTVTQTSATEQIEAEETAEQNSSEDYIVVVDTDVMGHGSEELGKNLLKGFLYSLAEQDVLPQKVIFYNGGVFSLKEDADSLEDMKALADQGVEIYACGACLNFYDITPGVGEVTNMYAIVEMMRKANRIVRP